MIQANPPVPAHRPSSIPRKLLIAMLAVLAKCLVALAAFASAPEPKPHSAWQAVIALPLGTNVDVKARSRHIHCVFLSANEETLTCTRGKTGSPIVLSRSEIRSVKIGHRGRSALIGAGVGGGALAVGAFAATSNPGDTFFGPNFLRGEATGLAALAGGILGGGIGALTDFSKSTVYSAQ
jgi:hypothetical protein